MLTRTEVRPYWVLDIAMLDMVLSDGTRPKLGVIVNGVTGEVINWYAGERRGDALRDGMRSALQAWGTPERILVDGALAAAVPADFLTAFGISLEIASCHAPSAMAKAERAVRRLVQSEARS